VYVSVCVRERGVRERGRERERERESERERVVVKSMTLVESDFYGQHS